jgi:hypothetical protein
MHFMHFMRDLKEASTASYGKSRRQEAAIAGGFAAPLRVKGRLKPARYQESS